MSLRFDISSITPSTGGGGGSANLTTLDVTPTTNTQSILPNTGYDGFNLVNVSAVNASIDPNITASNIVNGCNILGVTGTAQTGKMYNTTFSQIYGEVDANGVLAPTGNLMDIVFSGVKEFAPDAMASMWKGSSKINSIDCPDVDGVLRGFSGACEKSSIKSFKAENATSITGFNSAFNFSSHITDFIAPNVTQIGTRGMEFGFYHAVQLNTFNMQSLEEVRDYAMDNCFTLAVANNSTAFDLSSFPFSNLKRVYPSAFRMCFTNRKWNANNIYFTNLYAVCPNAFSYAFQNYSLGSVDKHIYFNSLIPQFAEMYTSSRATTSFDNMLRNRQGVIVHFPSNLEPVINTWSDVLVGFGGTSTSVWFDLPPAPEPENEYIINNGVLENYAFSREPLNFTGVTEVADGVLRDCKGYMGTANEISFPDLVTAGNYSFSYAFSNNVNIASLEFPNLTTAYNNSFTAACRNCINLESFSAPSLTNVGDGALLSLFRNCSNLTEVNLCSLTDLKDSYMLFIGDTKLQTVNLHSLVSLNRANAFFSGLTSLVTLDTTNLSSVGANMVDMFRNCRSLTMTRVPEIVTAFDSATNTQNMFRDSGVTEVNFVNLTGGAEGTGSANMCYNCQNLTTVNMGELEQVTSTSVGYFYRAYAECPNLTTVNYAHLKVAQPNCFREAFVNDVNLSTIAFDKLNAIGANAFYNAFNGSGLTDIYFNSKSATNSQAYSFWGMLSGTDGVNIHLPANYSGISLYQGYPNFGGTNVTIINDL